jgi:hypothetical protein
MTLEEWKIKTEQMAKRDQERRKLEAHFNEEIRRRYQSGQSKDEIVSSMGISNTLFNRVVRHDRRKP